MWKCNKYENVKIGDGTWFHNVPPAPKTGTRIRWIYTALVYSFLSTQQGHHG